jgi:hypothetical protein
VPLIGLIGCDCELKLDTRASFLQGAYPKAPLSSFQGISGGLLSRYLHYALKRETYEFTDLVY